MTLFLILICQDRVWWRFDLAYVIKRWKMIWCGNMVWTQCIINWDRALVEVAWCLLVRRGAPRGWRRSRWFMPWCSTRYVCGGCCTSLALCSTGLSWSGWLWWYPFLCSPRLFLHWWPGGTCLRRRKRTISKVEVRKIQLIFISVLLKNWGSKGSVL